MASIGADAAPSNQSSQRIMSLRIKSGVGALCLALATPTTGGAAGVSDKVRPSDCRPRDADSTCATAVAGETVTDPPVKTGGALYDGPLGGVPASGYAYWGFDFFADQWGYPSAVRQDEFVNRSNVPVTIQLSFTIPVSHPCNKDCLPGVQFQVDAGWFKLDPPAVIDGNTATVSSTFRPGQGYGWVIALWQASHARLTVTVPRGSAATLADVGMPPAPAVANEVAAMTTSCECWDGSSALCSYGRRFSNGLLGSWDQHFSMYTRDGAFSSCPVNTP
jgi:hypothetical protein